MEKTILPKRLKGNATNDFCDSRQITIIGGNGAGKSSFMEEMMELCGPRAYCLSALGAFFPSADESTMPGSIDALYREAIRQQSYMRTDAVSQLDKLSYMLFADEVESLLNIKESVHLGGKGKKQVFKPSKLDKIKRIWERIFPGNKIMRTSGRLLFSTTAGNDLVGTPSLSQGEKTVLYYLGAVLFAMPEAVIFIDSPSLFVHPSIMGSLWNSIESLRPDCTFVYNSVDVDFVSSRTRNTCIWVKSFDKERHAWAYEILPTDQLKEDLLVELAGSRKPVLFIEGDARHSIDARLYSLVFRDMTVKPLGSCNKVIETTRSFNDMTTLHHLRSRGIVDRDRRTDKEVDYLRQKQIMVPDVAEVENIFLLPDVIKIMAKARGKDAGKILRRVKQQVVRNFKRHSDEQALQHVRHKVKRDVECRIDARFSCITALETHLKQLWVKLEPRKYYNQVREHFAMLARDEDYEGILLVFNHKPMLPESCVHTLLGYKTKEDYISGVLDLLKSNTKDSEAVRQVVMRCLHAETPEEAYEIQNKNN